MSTPSFARPERDPDLLEALKMWHDAQMAEVHTMIPAVVESYDGNFLASVTPVLKRMYLDEDGNQVEVKYPTIVDAPVLFPRAGGFVIRWPLKKNDPVWLLVPQRSIDAYLETDGKSPIAPGDARRFHVTDAAVYPGGGTVRNPPGGANADNLVIGLESGAQIHVTPGGEIILGSADGAQALALASVVDARLSALESHANSHAHTAPPFGGATTPAIDPLVPGDGGESTASKRVFADE